ncbi:MAG: phosphate acyltransferase PlsX [Hyphomicrobiaceae bacterium]|nr:phosphate acyltransferase PlsX [Hyphomicrobiaceae bacterium]
MTIERTIALDVMGGDFGPAVVIPGASISLLRNPELKFSLFGDEAAILRELNGHPELAARSNIYHTDSAIAMDDKPSQALRRGKGSSMWKSITAVKDGDADVVISAGNTGALMAMTKLVLRPVAGIDRPAIAAIWPTVRSECIVLDVGANIGANAKQLCDYALMGAAMARALFHIERPSVALLNVGVEEIKGAIEVKETHSRLRHARDLPMRYHGFIEGDQIGQGLVNVVVVEGFAGNIALKTAEGTARQISRYLKDAMQRSFCSKVGAFLAQGGFSILKTKMDPRRANGGTFLGLNGIAIKSHGGTDALGFASAIDIGYDMAESKLVKRFSEDLNNFYRQITDQLNS